MDFDPWFFILLFFFFFFFSSDYIFCLLKGDKCDFQRDTTHNIRNDRNDNDINKPN